MEDNRTEEERLKAAAAESATKGRLDELEKYVDLLFANVHAALKAESRAWLACLASWIACLALDLFFPWGKGFWFLTYIFGLSYEHWFNRKLARAFAELDGAIKTLQILGLWPEDREPPRRRRALEELVQKVVDWAKSKRRAREKVYGPATA